MRFKNYINFNSNIALKSYSLVKQSFYKAVKLDGELARSGSL